MKSYAHRGGVQDMWCRRGIQEVRLLGIKELMSGWHCQCLPELLNHFYWAVFCFSNRQFLQILRKKQPLKTLRWLVQAELCSSFFQSRPGKNQEKSLQRASQWKVTEVTWCHTGSISHDFCTHEMNWTRGTSPLATWNSQWLLILLRQQRHAPHTLQHRDTGKLFLQNHLGTEGVH